MSNNFTSLRLSYSNAFNLKNRFIESDRNNVYYAFLGNSNIQNDENIVPDIIYTTVQERAIWDNMYAAKIISSYGVELVIPRRNWEANTKYKQFDDNVLFDDLLVANNTTGHQPMYIITDELKVYKCVSNNNDAVSVDKPIYDYSSENGYSKTSDGYIWKYMYSINSYNKYLTDEWIPVPIRVYDIEYNSSDLNLLAGSVNAIVVENSGSGYIDSVINLSQNYEVGCSIISVETTNNIVQNMSISGYGIINDTYITNIDSVYNKVTLSSPTIYRSNVGNSVSITTRAVISGDGSGARSNVVISGGEVEKVEMSSIGSGYKFASINIYGSGNGANARVILGPRYGHGYNPGKELGTQHLMFYAEIGLPDSTEGGIISTDTSFRQYGILRNPNKFGEPYPVYLPNTKAVISQTTNITLLPGELYNLGEYVYQGTSRGNSSFSGIVHAQTENEVRLTNVKGSISIGSLLNGEGSYISRAVVSYNHPEFEPYSGDIIFIKNTKKVERSLGQSEILKFVIKV